MSHANEPTAMSTLDRSSSCEAPSSTPFSTMPNVMAAERALDPATSGREIKQGGQAGQHGRDGTTVRSAD